MAMTMAARESEAKWSCGLRRCGWNVTPHRIISPGKAFTLYMCISASADEVCEYRFVTMS